jgi:hypothetical protein
MDHIGIEAALTAIPNVGAVVGEPRPNAKKGKVAPPRRVANRERRTREYLTPREIAKLINAAGRVGR